MGALQRHRRAHRRGDLRQCGPGAAAGPDHQLLNLLQSETSIPWDDMRHDAFTFKVAMAQLAAHRPTVFYLALGETDDWAHDGRYDRVLEAYARSDAYLAQLWNWLESQPDYKGRTIFSSRPIMGAVEPPRIGEITARRLRARRMCGLRLRRRRWLDAVNGKRMRRSPRARSRRHWRAGSASIGIRCGRTRASRSADAAG